MAAEAAADIGVVPLMSACCEVPATQPRMFLGLPRTLAAAIMGAGAQVLVFSDRWEVWAGTAVFCVMLWFAVKEQVSRDLWGFDNFLAWVATDFRFMDIGGEDGWGGARICAMPLNPEGPVGVSRHAAR